MTTSEHADLIAALERKAVFFERMVGQGENETHALLRQAAAALASSPSPAQQAAADRITEIGVELGLIAPTPARPTQANERKALARLLFDIAHDNDDYWENFEWGEYVESTFYARADAILAAGFRLAPSPVQGAGDRLAQAEAVIAEIAAVLEETHTDREAMLERVWRIAEKIATYQQSPQAALNEVRAGALEDAANAVDAEAPDEPWAGASFESHATWLRARAAELRAGAQTGESE